MDSFDLKAIKNNSFHLFYIKAMTKMILPNLYIAQLIKDLSILIKIDKINYLHKEFSYVFHKLWSLICFIY